MELVPFSSSVGRRLWRLPAGGVSLWGVPVGCPGAWGGLGVTVHAGRRGHRLTAAKPVSLTGV